MHPPVMADLAKTLNQESETGHGCSRGHSPQHHHGMREKAALLGITDVQAPVESVHRSRQ